MGLDTENQKQRERMGVDAMGISVQVRRFLFISIRTSYRSVCKHPFLVGFVLFLIFLYRSFPFLFSLLVSASPVLVCTAVLLGTLLSFGEPNIPEIEIEKDEEITHDLSSLKRGVGGDSTIVFERDGNFFVENLVGKRKVETEEGFGKESWEENGISKIKGDDDLGDYMPLINESSREIQFEKQVTEMAREFDVLELMKKMEIHEAKQGEEVLINGKAVESHYSVVQNVGNERLQVEEPKRTGESVQNEKGSHLNSWNSSRGLANDDDDDDEDEEDEEASDSGSDGAESSSPDASMADILPMLDELHPLLYERTPQPANMSDAGSEQSHRSKESDIESEDGTEKAHGEEDGDDDNEEEEEEGPRGKDDAIKWTEDDQKNLMDLGTSDLERNIRLESLIVRRRARSNLKMLAEKNLIDLDGADLPHNIPTITTRRNPFDFSFDSIDDGPGSAPSILLPRRNPFDIPYDSNEEKPDLKGDSFQQEFSPVQHRDMVFRRHESFSVGPSVLGGPRHDFRWKPYFVPERFGTEETSYNTFQRQLSGASDSKLSSVPDTESVSSAMEEEDKKLNVDVSQETDMLSNVDHSSVLVERGSLSSDGHDALDLEDEEMNVHHNGDEIAVGDVENLHEYSSLSTSGGATPIEVNTTEILLKMEPGEDEYSSRSSVSSSSEIDERISDVKKDEMYPGPSNGQSKESQISTQTSIDSDFHFMSEVTDENQQTPVLEPSSNNTAEAVSVVQRSVDSNTSYIEDENRCTQHVSESAGNHVGDSSIPMQASLDSESHIMRKVVENDQHKEPVYDSSPRAVDKLISFTSISSDTLGETSETASAELTGKESAESMEKDASANRKTCEHTSPDENESRSGEITELEHDVTEGLPKNDDRTCSGQNGKDESMNPKSGVDSPLSSSNKGSANEDLQQKDKTSNDDAEIHDNSSLQSDKQLSWSDKSMLEPSLSDGEEFVDAATSIIKESTKDGSITNNETSEPTSVASENVEYKSQVDEFDLKDSILDKIVYEDSGHILESTDYSEETDGPPVAEENTSEFEDAIKEIDEGLLSELDTVGDFSVKKVVGESSDYGLLTNVAEVGSSSCTTEPPVLKENVEHMSKTLQEVNGVDCSSSTNGVDLQVVERRSLKGVVEQHILNSASKNSDPIVKFVRFTVVATEEGIIQKTEEESGDEETNMKTPRESFDVALDLSSEDANDEKDDEKDANDEKS
ncbi:uncharacterized protein [Euphorbia lathyris]|uniref:uncharacterized protein n=1 Tax=Euphorbia lathyris TaxID=212925 RepID=UPI003313DC08